MLSTTTKKTSQTAALYRVLASLLLLLSGGTLAQNLQDVTMVREIERANSIRGMALSPDEQLLAVTQEETIEIVELATGEILHTLEEHTDDVNSVAFSSDGSFLASGSWDNTVKIWRTADFSLVESLEEHTSWVSSVAFSPAGDFLASGSYKTVKIWRTADFSLVESLEEHTSFVNSVAFSPAGDFLASGSGDRTVKIWRTTDFSLVHSLAEHTNTVLSVAFSPAGDFLASGSWDNTVKIWRTNDFSLVDSLEEHTSNVLSVAFSPAGDFLASGSLDNTVKIWQVASGRLLRTLPRATLPVTNLIYSAAGDYLLASPSKGGAGWVTTAEGTNAVQFWATPERAAVFCPRCGELAPQLYVLSPSNNSLLQRNQDEVQLQLSVGEASGVDIVVQANGQNLGLLNTRDFRAQATGTRLLRVDIPPQLQNRDLNLNIIASNSAGNSSQALYLRYEASPPPPTTGRKVLIIGNSNYPGQLYLRNPHNDAHALQEAFASLGFGVTMELDVPDSLSLETIVNRFAQTLNPDDVAIIYFSGHGMQLDNINYLIPTQASTVSLASLKRTSVTANYLLDELRFAGVETSIIILDACRNLPDLPQFSSDGRSLMGRGLAPMDRVEGTVIAYAAAPGQKALDNIPNCSGNTCNLSPYVTYLSDALGNPSYNSNVLDVFEEVQIQVHAATGGRQQPEIVSRLYQRVSLRD